MLSSAHSAPTSRSYSGLGSFGTIDYVASTILPQCGASGACQLESGDAIEGRMIEQAVVRGNYVYDYTIEQRGGPKRHLRSVSSMRRRAYLADFHP